MATRQSREARRASINGVRNKLNVRGKDPNYVYRIVNDIDQGDRIQQFKDRGYELVGSDKVKVGDKRVDSSSPEGTQAQINVGQGVKAFVMRIPKEWYDEDQAIKEEEIRKTEATMEQEAKADYDKGKLEKERQFNP